MIFVIISNVVTICLCLYIIDEIKKIKKLLSQKEKEIEHPKKQKKPKIIAHTDEKLYQRERDENY